MKEQTSFTSAKGWAITFLCLFFALASVSAQTRFDYDLTETIKNLPAKDGTYLVKTDKNVNIYAVKKDGQLSAIEFKDKTGKIIPSEAEPEPAPPPGSSERTHLACRCCIPTGCIRYASPCDRCGGS